MSPGNEPLDLDEIKAWLADLLAGKAEAWGPTNVCVRVGRLVAEVERLRAGNPRPPKHGAIHVDIYGAPPPNTGLNPAAMQEAYELGRRHGRGGR